MNIKLLNVQLKAAVLNCPNCGQNHEKVLITYYKLQSNYGWFACPQLNEPVVVNLENVDLNEFLENRATADILKTPYAYNIK